MTWGNIQTSLVAVVARKTVVGGVGGCVHLGRGEEWVGGGGGGGGTGHQQESPTGSPGENI